MVNMGAITVHRNKFAHVEYLDVAIKDNVDVDITQEFSARQSLSSKRQRATVVC